MLGFTELSIAEVPPQSKTHGYLQEVLKANQRARGLVKQILACSRQMASERITLRLGQMAKEVLRLMNASLPNNIRCRSEIKTEQDWVLADPTQIHQILVNLCINAAYAMRAKGGELVIRVSPFLVNESGSPIVLPPGNYVCLEVSDTGVGIPPEIVSRIFEPFFTTKPQGEGTGLGLSVAHGIVTSHHGAIAVESQVGKGTVFRVFLPKANQPAEAQAQEDQKPVKGHGRVLLVDDEDALVKMMQPRLRALGYRVTTRLDSMDAWRTFQAAPQSFDVIITDLNMPQMSGVGFLQHARKVRSDIPVILFSGQITDLDKLLSMGFNAVLAKPINMASFSRTLSDCCAKVKATGK
jgi:CheY-like chemotaxis protein